MDKRVKRFIKEEDAEKKLLSIKSNLINALYKSDALGDVLHVTKLNLRELQSLKRRVIITENTRIIHILSKNACLAISNEPAILRRSGIPLDINQITVKDFSKIRVRDLMKMEGLNSWSIALVKKAMTATGYRLKK